MKAALFGLIVAGLAAPASAQALVVLGENSGGRQILVDVTSLSSSAPIFSLRDFHAMQVTAELRSSAGKGSVERVRYSFNCTAKSMATLAYQRIAGGKQSHDWKGADIALKYDPVGPGTLAEMAMTYACNGGKLPKKPVQPTVPVTGDTNDSDAARDGDSS